MQTIESADGSLIVDGIEFIDGWTGVSRSDRFVLVKPGPLRDAYISLLRAAQGQRVLEIGIFLGGSAVLAALLARPQKLVVVDILDPVEALDQFIADRGLGEVVRPYYRTDQRDRVRLAEIIRLEFDGRPLDLVIDDASHLLAETRTSFEAVFPFVAPGGRYLIEDWTWGPLAVRDLTELLRNPEAFETAMQGLGHDWLLRTGSDPDSMVHPGATGVVKRALSRGGDEAERARRAIEQYSWSLDVPLRRNLASIAVDLVAVASARPEVIERVEVDQHWVTVTRGPGALPEEGWSLLEFAAEAEALLGIGDLDARS